MDQGVSVDGRVMSVLFSNPDNGYSVLKIASEGESGEAETVTAVGCFPQIAPGEDVVLTGTWSNHPDYGRQLNVTWAERYLPEDESGMQLFIGSGLLSGIGSRTAARIVETFGAETYDVLSAQPERLSAVKNITPERAKEICAQFSSLMDLRRLMEFAGNMGLATAVALRLHMVLGSAAIDKLTSNPYILASGDFGVKFQDADRLAMQMGISADSDLRMDAAVLHELHFNGRSGHLFVPYAKLVAAAAQLLQLASPAPAEDALERLIATGQIVCEHICGVDACYLAENYEAECDVALRLAQSAAMESVLREADLLPLLDKAERSLGITYADRQREAILCAAKHGVMVLTGGPGTGKTTAIRGILLLFRQMGLSVCAAAPTGRAAKRISQLCDVEAKTIHRLLEAGASSDQQLTGFARNEDNPLDTDAIVIDELSMVDIPLMQALLKALRPDVRIVLVGDADQLPSVGPGNVLRDLIASGVIPAVHLDEIFRQAKESAIITGAHAINDGQMPAISGKKDFFLMKRGSVPQIRDTIVELCSKRLPGYQGLSAADIQVITPTKMREAGSVQLNQALQAALNPGKPGSAELKLAGCVLRAGDRVMQTRNNYDLAWDNLTHTESGLGVFNGDIGVIEEIDRETELVTVRFDDRYCAYTYEQAGELELAYAITVHKAQGSEFPCVVFALSDSAPRLLTRNLLYTGVTRARSLLVAVGLPETMGNMVRNNLPTRRYTALRARLKRECAALNGTASAE